MSTTILTATKVLAPLELERLRLHAFRAPNKDRMYFDVDVIVKYHLTEEIAKDFLAVEETTYVEDGEVTYCFQRFSDVSVFHRVVNRFNETEQVTGETTGLVESDLANLTITFAYPSEVIREVINTYLALYIESTKFLFNSN